MTERDGVRSLVDLGFNGLEAEVYAHLLHDPAVTGYRVAQAIRKPAANTYKALESLQAKGAVLVDEGASRLYRAVPPEEFLGQLDRRFQEHRSRALRALGRIRGGAGDDRVYQLRSSSHVLERCRTMLGRCRRLALVDVFPEPLEIVRGDIESAAARGVAVAMRVYRPAAIAGVEVVVALDGEEIIARWPGQWLNVVVDGQEHLLALFAPGSGAVHQAIWSGSAYLSWIYHSALHSEIANSALEHEIAGRAPHAELKRVLKRFQRFLPRDAPGRTTLLQRFGGNSKED
ncbi:MAG: TrmB family transcriptional regulator [Planctomycetes bacterium]|nr:TrmB family transcriptional regulator [Planctomycetota bacterium]